MSDIFVPFGKHRGTRLEDTDPGYLTWMLNKSEQQDAWQGLVSFVENYREEIEQAIADAQSAKLASIDFNYTLSPSQEAASEFLCEWLLSTDTAAKLEGGAGYGKSFTVKDVLRFAMQQGYKVAAAATSYVATQVLVNDLEPLGVDVRTIARHLQLTVERDGKETNYVFGEKSPERLETLLSRGHLLVVDEYSMVGDEVGQALLDAVNLHGGKLLAVGDLKQLPPVKQAEDSCLAGIPVSVSLSDPMRYSRESDLYKVEQIARTQPHALLNNPEQWADSEQVNVVPDSEELIFDYCTEFNSSGDDCRILYYRRADVVATNHQVRKILYGEQSEQLVVEDEKLLVAATSDVYQELSVALFRPEDAKTNRFYSGTSFQVSAHEVDVIEGVPCHIVKFEDGREAPVIFMVSENKADESTLGGTEYTQKLRELAEDAKAQVERGVAPRQAWHGYHAFRRSFLPVMYGYAMTVHRCQGQTVDRAYIEPRMLVNAGGPQVGHKLLYVAATRAKKRLTMVL